jgi:hypothetical protein
VDAQGATLGCRVVFGMSVPEYLPAIYIMRNPLRYMTRRSSVSILSYVFYLKSQLRQLSICFVS